MHPRSHIGHERSASPDPIVEAVQRPKGAFHWTARQSALALTCSISSAIERMQTRGLIIIVVIGGPKPTRLRIDCHFAGFPVQGSARFDISAGARDDDVR